METQVDHKSRIFKGAGILIGFVFGSVVGIVVASITGVIGIIGSVSASVALPAGLYLERKFQKGHTGRPRNYQNIYLLLFLIGIVLFFICFLL